MTQVLFSFDTEDYVNIEAEEAVLRLAQTLSDEDLQGCFCVVGEVAAAWRQRDSRAVLDALRAHEVDAHTWRHSWHPNIVEYSEDPDWAGSLARFLREERYAFDLVMDVCDRERIWAFVKPGNYVRTWDDGCARLRNSTLLVKGKRFSLMQQGSNGM